MEIGDLMNRVKTHPDFSKAGMVLCHNGVVRETSRDGRRVSGLSVQVNHEKLDEIISRQRKKEGIVEILVEIAEGKKLRVGDDVMYIVVAGDVRENVIETLTETLNEVKKEVTSKTEYYLEAEQE